MEKDVRRCSNLAGSEIGVANSTTDRGDVGPDKSENILSNDSCRMNHTLQSNGFDDGIWRWFLGGLPRCPAFPRSGLGNVFIPTPVLGNPPLRNVRRLLNPLNGFFAMLLCHLFK